MSMNKRQTFRESGAIDLSSGSSVDRTNNVIRNVKILGWSSLNGRLYDAEKMKAYVGKYEGASVNLNHKDDRDIQDRAAWLQNVVWTPEGYRGDLYYNPFVITGAILWWCENKPSKIGLSHSVIAEGESNSEGLFVIDTIVEVESVDFVANPATTKGVFESVKTKIKGKEDDLNAPPVVPAPGADPIISDDPTIVDHALDMIAVVLKGEGDFTTKKAKAIQILKLLDDGKGTPANDTPPEPEESDDDQDDKPEESEDDKDDDKKADESFVKASCYDAKVTVSESFVKTLVGLPKVTVTALIADKKKESSSQRPQSKPQQSASASKPQRSRESSANAFRS